MALEVKDFGFRTGRIADYLWRDAIVAVTNGAKKEIVVIVMSDPHISPSLQLGHGIFSVETVRMEYKIKPLYLTNPSERFTQSGFTFASIRPRFNRNPKITSLFSFL